MNDTLNPLSGQTAAIEKRIAQSEKQSDDRAALAATLRLFAVISVALILFFSFFGFHTVRDSDMYPALVSGDLVLTYSKVDYRKGEIVLYEAGGKKRLGRIVAKEGDTIDFSSDGKFYVNGTAQVTDIAFPTYPPSDWKGRTVVPEGTVYVLGDFRTRSEDSRTVGFVSKKSVVSKVIALLRHNQL
jgi:signal peptidase I